MKKVVFIIGARPNYMKLAPLLRYYKSNSKIFESLISIEIVHTNQHSDLLMSKTLLRQLDIPDLQINLYNEGELNHHWSIGKSLDKLISLFSELKPDWIIVFGDINSTLIASIAAKYLKISLAHIEGGLRSFDREMPEEINRLATDSISDLLYTTTEDAYNQLLLEGIPNNKIFNIGNLMIDTLMYYYQTLLTSFDNKEQESYAILTLHRPSNVDNYERLMQICFTLQRIARKIKILFPIHPRTKNNLIKFGLEGKLIHPNINILPPVDYFEMIKLYRNCSFVVTDSGGVQEETTALKIPCLTLRENTERPITVEIGSSTLVGFNMELLLEQVDSILSNKYKKSSIPPLWDGLAANRFWNHFLERIK